MPRSITSTTSLENLRREAKRWLNAIRAGDAEARARLDRAFPNAPATPTLRHVQHALAREHGQDDWRALRSAVSRPIADADAAPPRLRTADAYAQLADDMVLAFDRHDDGALQRLNGHYGRTFTFDDLWAEIWRRVYSFRQRAFKSQSPQRLERAEAEMVIAQDAGFGSWAALLAALTTGAPPVPAYVIDPENDRIAPRRRLSDEEWDELLAAMKERRIRTLDAAGLMTDSLLARVATLDHVTGLDLGGSRELTDVGLHHLARMPQLEHLNLSEYPGGRLTDRGLAVLRHLPSLRTFEMTWQRGITDAGIANLRGCDRLERVTLMGSPTGDGAIEVLQAKPQLREFSSGRLVTDAGLGLLQNFPLLKQSNEGQYDADTSNIVGGGRLLIDGPFTNDGIARLAGLDGVVDLDLFWHVTRITADAFAHLAALPNLLSLGADGELTSNMAMRHIAALPRLRKLRAQETVADDDGFRALSRSRTVERLWTRETPNLSGRGFIALSTMPALRGLGVSCRNVDDDALSTLPRFPALRQLTPIDVQDDGFRHIGRCERLEHLSCMYCRQTTDLATERIASLPLKSYYAGLTQITDRSLEILGRMQTLEHIEFYECNGVTDAGLVFLAGLPRLREVALDGLPGVTFEGTRVFPASVRVRYST